MKTGQGCCLAVSSCCWFVLTKVISATLKGSKNDHSAGIYFEIYADLYLSEPNSLNHDHPRVGLGICDCVPFDWGSAYITNQLVWRDEEVSLGK